MGKLKCEDCGHTKSSQYKYDRCPRCGGTMSGKEKIPTIKLKSVNQLLTHLGQR